MILMTNRPLAQGQARKLLSAILSSVHGQIFFSGHARREMETDDLTMAEVFGMLRIGRIHEPAELVRGSWRYRVHCVAGCVVVTFPAEKICKVVTAWRK